MLFYKIWNGELNVPSEGIIIPAKEKTRKRQAHNQYIHIGSNKDDY